MINSEQNRIIYDSDQFDSPMIEEFHGIQEHFFILRRLVLTNFKTRYKRSYLGIIWSMLNPLLNMIVFVIVFSYLFNRNIDHFAVYVLTGNMIFEYFRQSTSEAMVQMISRGPMMRRIYLPKTTYVLSSVGINLINLILTIIPLIIVSLFDHIQFTPMMLMTLPCIALFTLFNIGASLLVSSIVPYLHDFSQIWNVLMTVWMYLTPIFYPETIIAPKYLQYFRLNPITVYLTIFRSAYIDGIFPPAHLWLKAAGFAVAAFMIGWYFFTKNSNDFAYRT